MTTLATGLSVLSIAALAILMIAAAVGDARRYIIPNRLCLCVAGAFVVFLVAQALTPADARAISVSAPALLKMLGITLVVLAACVVLFATNVMGGGDVKLITAGSLWAGPDLIMSFLFLTAISGGVVTAVVMIRARRLPAENGADSAAPSSVVNHPSLNVGPKSTDREDRPGVPYGVAIAVGGLFVAATLLAQTVP
ncbi:MAG: prepilin peptidase [Sphingomonadales bacterium]